MTTCGKEGCVSRFFPSGFGDSLKRLLVQAWPIVFTQFNLTMFPFISLPFIARLDETQMAALGLGTTTVNIFGLSVLLGLFTACETLLSQAFGEMNLKNVSVFCQQSLLVGFVVSTPLIAIILNSGSILRLMGQKEAIVEATKSYLLWYLPVIPLISFYLMLMKFLQCQFIVIPCAVCGFIANIFNVGFHILLINFWKLGVRGAAISVFLTHLIFSMLLIAFIIHQDLLKDIWNGFSYEALLHWKVYLKLAIPGMAMICLQFWAFEVGMIGCAIIGPEDLDAYLILQQCVAIAFSIHVGVSTASSISVGNALGSGDSERAKTMANVSFIVAIVTGCLIMIPLLTLRSVIPHLFTSLPKIIHLVTKSMPINAVFQLADALASITNGVVRGCGRQRVAAIINLVGYYVLSLPVGISLSYKWGAGLGVMGFWLGLLLAQTVISLLLLFYQFFVINWDKEVDLAKQRLSLRRQNSPRDKRKKIGENGTRVTCAEGRADSCHVADIDEDELDTPTQDASNSRTDDISGDDQTLSLVSDTQTQLEDRGNTALTPEEIKNQIKDIRYRITAVFGFMILTLAAGIVLRLWSDGLFGKPHLVATV